MEVLSVLQAQQSYFEQGHTMSYAFRKRQLEKLKAALYTYEQPIYEALYADLKKNKEESWVTEIGFTIAEVNHAIKHLKRWMEPVKTKTNLLNFPSRSYILSEPLGMVLIIGPWNYPLQLLLAPLIGAIAAGNCAMLKPSEFAPATAAVLDRIIKDTFDQKYISIMQGDGAVVIPQMMEGFRFDHVFYTGSTRVGTIIYEMAAKKLVPVTLELGGKSPCIVEKDADIKIAARRIALTKFSNAGQMCVAPDYLLVHESIKETFLEQLKEQIHSFYNAEMVRDYHYGKIINEKAFNRLVDYIKAGKVIYGGTYDADTHFIEPTLLEQVKADDPVMKEEIFGPLLPVLTWKEDEEVYNIIRTNKNPLAFYVFTGSQDKARQWTRTIPFGGGCINNASWHLTNHNLPFGGRGDSGIGAYHGRFSFRTFSHQKAIMDTPTWLDPSVRYPPFKGKLNLFRRFIR